MSQEPSKEIKAVADSVLGAFNSKNSKLFNDSFASEVAIIDGFAPFRWTGPNAQARWWADAERWGEQLGVSSERISVEKDASLAGGRDSRLRCPFSDAYHCTGERGIDHQARNTHIHRHQAERTVEGRVTDLGSAKLKRSHPRGT